MNLLFSAASGWGKSFHAQAFIEENIPEYQATVVLDYKDEYRGLVKGGLAKHYIAGPVELQAFGRSEWRELLRRNPRLVLARYDLTDEGWREVCSAVIRELRALSRTTLVVVDEAHFVAPQSTKLPHQVKHLATTGRGEEFSGMWITQRLAELDETVIGNSTARMLGGYQSDRDTGKVAPVLEYPKEAHMAGGRKVHGLPDELHAPDAGPVSVRKFEEGDKLVGSEWIWSTDSGDLDRVDTRGMASSMKTTHYGKQGLKIRRP